MPCLARAARQVELSLREQMLRDDCGLAEADFARASAEVDAGASLEVMTKATSEPRCLRAVGSTTGTQPTVLVVKDGHGRVLARSAGRSLLIAPAEGPLCVPPGVSLEARLEDLEGLGIPSGRLSLVEVR